MLYDVRKPAELDDDWSYRQALCLGDEELHWDGGEPEDNSYGRDWSWVPDLLNKERGRWIQLQEELQVFLEELLNDDIIDSDLYLQLNRKFANRFDPDKE